MYYLQPLKWVLIQNKPINSINVVLYTDRGN